MKINKKISSAVTLLLVFFQCFVLMAASNSNQTFKPAVDDSDYFSVYSSPVLKQNKYHLGLMFDYFHNPIVLGNASGFATIREVNPDVFMGHLSGSYGVFKNFSVGAHVPFYLSNDVIGTSSGMDVGDAELYLKYQLLDKSKSILGLSALGFGVLPTATHANTRYTGNDSFGGGLKVVVDSQVHKRVAVALNAGIEARNTFTAADGNKYGNEMQLGAAVAVDIIPKKLKVIAENTVDTQLNDFFKKVSTPMEAKLGLRYRSKMGLNFNLGGGMGYRKGFASPEYRMFAGATYTRGRIDEFKLPEAVADEYYIEQKEWDELQLGEELKLRDKIYFDYDSAQVREISKPTLNRLAIFLSKNPEFKRLRIEGNTCDLGGKAYNQKLSLKRAENVKSYLVEQGVESERLSVLGRGMDAPIVPNVDEASREQNRRVGIFVEEKN